MPETLEQRLARRARERAAATRQTATPATDTLEAKLEARAKKIGYDISTPDSSDIDVDVDGESRRLSTGQADWRPIGRHVRDELKGAASGLAEQARDLTRPGGVKRAAKGLVHGVVDPLVTFSEVAFMPPAMRAQRRADRDLEIAEAARRSEPGEYSEDAAEAAVSADRKRQTVRELMAVPQIAAMVAAPGISSAVGKKVASKVGNKLVGRVVSRITGESAASATFGATMDPEHPIAGAASMAVVGPILGEAGRGVGMVAKPAATAIRGAVRSALEEAKSRPAPAPRAAARASRTPEPDVAGVVPSANVFSHPVEEIHVDPSRFQFKINVDEKGVGRGLSSVEKYNPSLAGTLSVWKDPVDGKTYIVNGHHRLELAERTKTPRVDVQFLDAADASEARAQGALQNIAEGKGTPLDAAKFFRETGVGPEALKAEGVELTGRIAKSGLALSKLEPDVFAKVATGKISESHGAAIGSLLELPEQQRAAASLIENSPKKLSDQQATELVHQVRAAGSETVTQDSLFGTDEEGVSLIYNRAEIASTIKQRLAADKRMFGYVAKEGRASELARGGNQIDVERSSQIAGSSAVLEEAFNREAHAAGDVGRTITEAARRVANGEKLKTVVDDIYDPVREAVRASLERSGATHGSAIETGRRSGEPPPAEVGPGVEPEEVVPKFVDPDQDALFSARGNTDLFGNEIASDVPSQTSLLDESAGTAGTRSLSQAERAARSELEVLREQLPRETDPRKRVAAAARIAELERLVNRDRAISADELAARAAAGETRAEPAHAGATPLDQESLFSPAVQSGALRRRLAKVLSKSAPAADDVQALISITRNLSKAVGATVRQGRFLAGQRRAAGVFFTKSESIRIQRYDKVDTAAHEIGHYVSKKYLGNPTRKLTAGTAARVALPKTAKAELYQMGKNLYGNRKPNAGYGEEGIAEYFSFYVTEPNRLALEAPQFDAFMQQAIFKAEPALKSALDQARVDFADYQGGTPAQRFDAMISVNERVRNVPTARGIVASVFDDLNEFKLAVKELGGERDPARNAYTLARLTRGDAGAAGEMIERGIVDFKTKQRVSRGVEEILAEIPRERLQALRRYLAAERTIEVAERGIDTGFKISDAIALKAQLEPEFGTAAAELWDISQKLIDYRRDAGLLTDAEAKLIKDRNQKRVGFFRVFDENEAPGRGTGSGYGRNSSGIQSIKGSARRILDPLESLVTDVYRTVHQAHTHAVLSELVSLAKRTDGGAKIAEILTERPQHAVRMPIARIIDQLTDLGFEIPPNMPKDDLIRLSEGVLTHFEENVTPGPREAKDMIVPYVQNGERYWVALKDRRLFDAVKGLDRERLPQWARILTTPTRTLRAGATLTMEFIGRNPVRDAWTAAIYSRAGFKPPGYDFARGMFSLLKKDELYQRWRLEGGDNAAMLGLDRTAIQRSLEHYLRGGPEKLRDVVLHPIDFLRLASSAAENATRIGEFKSVYEKALKEGMPVESAAKEGAYAARDITIDFARAGTQGRMVNEIIAFFNANLQGSAKLVAELRDRPTTVIPRIAALITVPSIGLYLLHRNDPAYQELPRWERDLFWIWVQRGDDGEVSHIWRIPKPPEIGVLFGSVPERILEYIDKHDPGALDHMAKALMNATVPNVLPTGATPLVENWANKSWFRDRPIVSRGLERLPAENQATRYSSETSRVLGQVFGYSPAKIDNWIRGTFGGLGADYAVEIADRGIVGARRVAGKTPLSPPASSRSETVAQKIPGVRGFTAREPGADAESLEQMYRRFDSAEQRRQQWHELLKSGKRIEARAYLRENRAEILSVATAEDAGRTGPLRIAHQTVSKLRDVARQVETAPMPDDLRKIRIRKVYDAMIEAAQGSNPDHSAPADPVAAEVQDVGARIPASPDARRLARAVIDSPEYRGIDAIAAGLVERNPKYRGRSKKALARELKRDQIESAVTQATQAARAGARR